MSAGDIVNMAETAWKIIEGGKPSSQINSSTANAVPDVDDWQSISGARGPKTIWMRRWNQVGWPFDDYINVDFTINLRFEYGATYRGGGLFIPNIYVEVPECFVGWRYDVDIDIHVHNPSNGNESNPAAPVARVPVSISGTIGNDFWNDRVEWGVLLSGSGHWEWL
jgi:hypothetical protein